MKQVILLAAGLLISASAMAEVCPLKAAKEAKTTQAAKDRSAKEATLALNPNYVPTKAGQRRQVTR